MKKTIGVSVIAASLALASCSGGGTGGASSGGSGSTPTESSSATATAGALSGTAAVGAPLGLAAVTIKGSDGPCSTTAITGTTNSVGVYSITVPDDCTEPYLISVTGSTGSLKTIAPAKGIIANVTPLTELIAKRAANLSDLSGVDLSSIASTISAKLNTQETNIKSVLKGIAAGIGAASSEDAFEAMDLRSGSFAANGSGLDKLLDAVKINKSGSNENVVVGGVTVSVPVNPATPMPAAPDSTAVSSAVSAVSGKLEKLENARAFAKAFTNIFASSVPSQSTFNNFVSSSFKHDGANRDDFYDDLASDDELVGLQFRNIVILKDDPTDFWVAFQIFGIENGQYVQWGMWTSKIENPESDNPKLLGNTMEFGLSPHFIKTTTYASSDHTSTNDYLRAFRIDPMDGNLDAQITKFNDTTLTNTIVVANSLLDHTSTDSYNERNITGNASQYIKLGATEAIDPIIKLTYKYEGGTSKEVYIPAPAPAMEKSNYYMDFAMPSFNTSGCTWNVAALADANGYDLSGEEWEFSFAEIILQKPTDASIYAVMPQTYSEDDFENNLTNLLSNYSSITTGASTAKLGVAHVTQYGPGDLLYTHLYKCGN